MYVDDKIPRDCYVMHPTSFQGRRTQKLTIRKFGNLNLTKRNELYQDRYGTYAQRIKLF
jgi:hypothetical protein